MSETSELQHQLHQLTQSMSQLQQNIDHLEGKRTLEDARDNTTKWLTWGKALIGLVVFVVMIGFNMGVSLYKLDAVDTNVENLTLKVSTLETQLDSKIQTEVTKLKSNFEGKISKHESDILELQLKQAAQSPIITQIQKDVTEIKHDVKKLSRRN